MCVCFVCGLLRDDEGVCGCAFVLCSSAVCDCVLLYLNVFVCCLWFIVCVCDLVCDVVWCVYVCFCLCVLFVCFVSVLFERVCAFCLGCVV